MSDPLPFILLAYDHSGGEQPCGRLAYRSIGRHFAGIGCVFDGHVLLDESQPEPAFHSDIPCASCGHPTGVPYFPPPSSGVAAPS